ncbi:MAG: excinuclease ABC subunit UvrC [Myxococcaceae bacterium]|nr:excinuclease ABC subunit UvrC [Myxococcaceae bacterium]
MKDAKGKIFYVGKAINLRKRIKSYFSGQDTRRFVSWLDRILDSIEVILVRNNTEALLLEQTLIAKHKPRHNVLLKDDKRFLSLRLARSKPKGTLAEQYPRLEIIRKARADKARYFGPYPSASKLREMILQMNKQFQLRTCSDRVLGNRTRPCIQHQMGRCLAPCVLEVPEYESEIENVVLFLKGQTREIEERLKLRMLEAAGQENFERAAQIRDHIKAIQESTEKQAAYRLAKTNSEDVIAFAREGDLLEVVRMPIRAGRILGAEHYAFSDQEFPDEQVLTDFITQFYDNIQADDKPNELILPIDLDIEELEPFGFLIKQPKRGKQKDLLQIAYENAKHGLSERLKQEDTNHKALMALQKMIRLQELPRVIECFDISLFQGTDSVASQICFVDGVPEKSRYRKYNIKTVEGTDDFASMREVLSRRLKKGDFPDLLLVDGGKGQLSVAVALLKDLALNIPVASIAKDPERVFLPNVKEPIFLKHHTPERYLLERIRDEAHRFAITSHRKRRAKRILNS